MYIKKIFKNGLNKFDVDDIVVTEFFARYKILAVHNDISYSAIRLKIDGNIIPEIITDTGMISIPLTRIVIIEKWKK